MLSQMADKRLFLLVYQQTNPLQPLHGWPCALSQPQPHAWIHHLLPGLPHACATLGVAPERDASRVAPSPLALAGAPDGVLDGPECRRQRPPDAARQTGRYSGKKKTSPAKHLGLVNAHPPTVVALGPTVAGTTPDKQAADAAPMGSPTNATLGQDTGFQGEEPAGVLPPPPQKTARAGVARRG